MTRSASSSASSPGPRWHRTTFAVPAMDCPSEERMIRLPLDELEVVHELGFDLPGRRLTVVHRDAVDPVLERLLPLKLGARVESSEELDAPPERPEAATIAASDERERRVLWLLLAINGVMFVAEMLTGWWAQSTGLMADAHMRASWIVSTNDVLANLGVIVAGGLVAWTGSRVPDLVMGTILAAVVLLGAVRILRLR